MINSMTAFARSQAEGDWGRIVWELRSVNHRYLDVNIQMPDVFADMELAVRQLLAEYIQRGKVECRLQFRSGEAANNEVHLNKSLSQSLLTAAKQINVVTEQTTTIDPLTLLRWPGMVTVTMGDLEDVKMHCLDALTICVQQLRTVRKQEGEKLQTILQTKLKEIKKHVDQLLGESEQLVQQQRTKLQERLQKFEVQCDTERLEQEVAFLATKSDVNEELDRLNIHIIEVERLLKTGGVLGRRLDFLMQELHREANTLASKASEAKLSHISVELKVLIEQMREQIQNIE